MFSVMTVWFVTALFLIILEITGIFNFTALLTGFAALTVGVLIERGVIASDSLNVQIIVFCLLFTGYIFLSWLIFGFPFQSRSEEKFYDIVGSQATISGGNLHKTKTGKISWSGTFLPAKCHKSCQLDKLIEGQSVTIVEVKGNVAFVIPEKGDI